MFPSLRLIITGHTSTSSRPPMFTRLARTLITSSDMMMTMRMRTIIPRRRSLSSSPFIQINGQSHSYRFNSTSSFASASASASSVTKDDIHPHLYFHQLSHPSSSSSTTTRIALSYLSRPPSTSRSKTIIGWLPNDASAGVGDFIENPEFRTWMNHLIAQSITQGKAQSVEVEAMSRGSDGFMHIADQRNPPPSGRIPEPEDIIGTVYVKDGKPLPETYEPQPMHRLLTQDGVTVLPYGIDEYVLEILEKEE